MRLKQLQFLALLWRDRLNLREWSIDVGWGTQKEMEGLCGYCLWHAENLTAIVRLSKRQPEKEVTLVHELLHIVLQGHLSEVPTYDVHLERAINKVSAALVAANGQVS